MAVQSREQKALAETECNLAQIIGVVWEDPKSALPHGERALSLAREAHDEELEAKSLFLLGWIQIRAGNFAEAIRCLDASLPLYTALGNERTASRQLSIAHFLTGSPLTQPVAYHTSEAMGWAHLAVAQLHSELVDQSIHSGRRAVALAQESKNDWVHVISTNNLTHGLLDAGAYEEALVLTQHTTALARSLPPAVNFHVFLTALGSAYQAVQQLDEARSALEEAELVAERLELGPLRVPALSRLCMCYAAAGEWEPAFHYALKAHTVRENADVVLIVWDFHRPCDMEALLRGGAEGLARKAVRQLGERLGNQRRFRLPYLRSLAVLAAWDGNSEQAIGHLREAEALATDLGLPGERWQIQAMFGRLYEVAREHEPAYAAFREAATIVQELAGGIGDATRRATFLAGPQTQPVLQGAQRAAAQIPHTRLDPRMSDANSHESNPPPSPQPAATAH